MVLYNNFCFWIGDVGLEIFLLIAFGFIVLFFFMKGLFNYKNANQLTIRPFTEWVDLAATSSPKDKNLMCHALLVETGRLLEQNNIISQKDFRKLYEDSRVSFSNFVLTTVAATSKTSPISISDLKSSESDQARIYLYKCFLAIYKSGLGFEGKFYMREQSFLAISKLCYDLPDQEW